METVVSVDKYLNTNVTYETRGTCVWILQIGLLALKMHVMPMNQFNLIIWANYLINLN